MNLYTLRDDYARVLADLPEDGSLTDEQAAQLRAIGDKVEDKLDQYRRWYKNLHYDKDALEYEIHELQGKLDAVRKTQEWVKEELLRTLREMGTERVNFPVGHVRIQPNSIPSLVVPDESVVPQDWFRMKPELKKDAIKDYIERGGEVPGCSLVRGQHLRVT